MQRLPGVSLTGLPLPLPYEVSRPRLRGRLDARWQHRVTVIRAGAGFGKSTLLAQAVRANATEPRGIDVWHGCTPGDVDRDVLGQSLLEALGASGRCHDPASQIADIVATRAGEVDEPLAGRSACRAAARSRGRWRWPPDCMRAVTGTAADWPSGWSTRPPNRPAPSSAISFQHWDEGTHSWIGSSGTATVRAGTSSADIPLSATVEVHD